MKDIVYREDAVARITAEQKEEQDIDCIYIYSRCKTIIKHMPSAERTGKWIVKKDCEGKTRRCICDQCGHDTGLYTWENPNYCEDCGARMVTE